MANIDQYTAQLSPGSKASITGQYFDLYAPFALPRYGNACTSYICGRDYMKDVAAAIRSAQHFIFIADWQLDYDVELDQRGAPGHPGRLSELLADALQRGVHVRVLCYDSMDGLCYAVNKVGQGGPPDTHEEETQSKLDGLPAGKGSIKVMLQNSNTTRTNKFWKNDSNVMFSHHQKFVLVDGHIAFLGGLDLAYGRWETPAFEVAIDPSLHVLNDAYNQQVLPAREASVEEMALTHKQRNDRPGFAKPLYTGGGKLLDPAIQPRQPWNDVALRIEGPGAFDVFVNFVLRWNSFAKTWQGTNAFDQQLSAYWFERQAKGQTSLVDPLQVGSGSAAVQICRSASSAQLQDELALWDKARKYVQDDWKQPSPQRAEVMRNARKAWAGEHQTSIRDAMINCIRSAQAFIYIENQFFMSDCGTDAHGTACPSQNTIITELANAIAKAIYAGRAFHVWLVLPEHPEGMLEDEGTSSQAWWALQGVKHGSKSLIHRINATILDKNRKVWGVDKPLRTNQEILEILKVRGMENAWRDYLTVLNLRNYGQTAKGVITEMIYVHSKLMIVDDGVAIIGSANINDRSLLGNGDTELAAVVIDDAEAGWIDLGQGIKGPARKFARELRIKLWKKLFGMMIDTPTTGVQREATPPFGINLEKPLDKASIQGIQKLAAQNRAAYSRVFLHTPRNEFGTLLDGRKRYPPVMTRIPVYDDNSANQYTSYPTPSRWKEIPTRNPDFSRMPNLQPDYMKNGQHDIAKAVAELRSTVKGFLVEMPLDWGRKESHSPFPPRDNPILIGNNDKADHSLSIKS